jgi:hypothetical protein
MGGMFEGIHRATVARLDADAATPVYAGNKNAPVETTGALGRDAVLT